MFSPVLQGVIERHKYPIVTEESHDKLVGAENYTALLFAGDAGRLAESDDVAIVLPELEKAFENVFQPMVVDRDHERQLQRRYRFNAFPSLVFLRLGEYLGTIQQVRDWSDYVKEVGEILLREPTEPPAFKFPDGCGAPQPELPN